ncbi:MAG: PEGA domain-containing protein [Fibrobacteria bacterium]|nr:PEGA domain-containing protein [Fibrobacteria bacterium]
MMPKIFFFFLLCITPSLYAIPSYFIQNFVTDNQVQIPDSSIFIPHASPEKQCAHPDSLPSNLIFLRLKDSLSNYRLIPGEFLPRKFSSLQAYPIPNVPLQEAIRFTFFTKSKSFPSEDIPELYFCNKYLYTRHTGPVYYYKGIEWITLKKEFRAPGQYIIQTVPPHAEVYIDDRKIGNAPVIYSSISLRALAIKVKQNGYYEKVIPVYFMPGVISPIKVTLTKNVFPINDSLWIDEFSRLFVAAQKDIQTCLLNSDKIANKLSSLKKQFVPTLDAFEKQYPGFENKIPEETILENDHRKTVYEAELKKQKQILIQRFNRVDSTGRAISDRLDSVIYAYEFVYHSDTLPGSSIEHLEKLPDSDIWRIKIKAVTAPWKFKFSGKGILPRSFTPSKINTSTLPIVVHHWNQQYQTKKGTHYNIGLDSLELCIQNKVVPITGTFIFPKQIRNSRQYHRARERANYYKKTILQRKKEQSAHKAALIAQSKKQRKKRIKVILKNTMQYTSAAGFSIAAGCLWYMARLRTKSANNSYHRYQSSVNTQDATYYRQQVVQHDGNVKNYYLISGISFGFSFFLLTF